MPRQVCEKISLGYRVPKVCPVRYIYSEFKTDVKLNAVSISNIDIHSSGTYEITGKITKKILKPKSNGTIHALVTLDDGTGTIHLDLKPWQHEQVEVGDTICIHEAAVISSTGKPQIKTWEKTIDIITYTDPEKATKRQQVLKEKTLDKIDYEKLQLSRGTETVTNLYRKIKSEIISTFSDVTVKPTKTYVGFKHNTNFVDVAVYQSHLKLFINLRTGLLKDPKRIARDVSTTGHFGNGDYEVRISNDSNIEYAMKLVEQSYKKN